MNQTDSVILRALYIHPKWLIEENAINLRKDVWSSFPIALIIMDKTTLTNNRFFKLK